MTRLLALLATVLCAGAAALLGAGAASAHPLGDLTVNRSAAIDAAGGVVYVRYALDLAEIPTLQLEEEVRAPRFPERVAQGLELRIDGRRVELVPLRSRVRSTPGSGGLETLRFDALLVARATGRELRLVDRLFPERIGWREVTASARAGAVVRSTDVPAESASDVLRAYPVDRAPLDVRKATVQITPGRGEPAPPPLAGPAPVAVGGGGGGLESLIGRDASSVALVVSLLLAAFWGAVHALTPGHGKAIVAGYLVGTRGRPRDAVVLGATVAATHTAGVLALGVATLLLERFLVPEQIYPWLTLVSGLLVVAVGASVLRGRVRSGGWGHAHDHDHHGHDHGHGHDHHGHDHHGHDHHGHEAGRGGGVPVATRGGIVGVGVAAGILPCPSALVVLLGAIAVHRLGFGIALVGAFSLGLAATITAIGLVAVLARRTFARARLDGPLVRALPAVSAAAILLVGLALTARALPGVI